MVNGFCCYLAVFTQIFSVSNIDIEINTFYYSVVKAF